jgi:predicted O-methyltransferase YrrM
METANSPPLARAPRTANGASAPSTPPAATLSPAIAIVSNEHREQVPWTPPSPGAPANQPWGAIQTDHGPVRVAPPRGRIPGTLESPPPVPGPKIPWRKKALHRNDHQFCPAVDGQPIGHGEHGTRWTFPACLDNPNCRWLQTLKRMYAMPISFPASLSPEAGLLVHALVRNIRPRIVIETGTFIGMSTMWIAAALQENGDGGLIHTFDDFGPIKKGPWRDAELPSGRLPFVAGLLAEAGLAEHVVMHPGNSPFELRASHDEIRAAGGAQLAFLDADHGFVGVCQDFWAAEPVLNTGGFLLFHDTFPERCSHEGPRELLDRINRVGVGVYEKADLYLSPNNYGLAVARRLG